VFVSQIPSSASVPWLSPQESGTAQRYKLKFNLELDWQQESMRVGNLR
jgi:hypothetical protein